VNVFYTSLEVWSDNAKSNGVQLEVNLGTPKLDHSIKNRVVSIGMERRNNKCNKSWYL
jgi:hypothetical protein